VSVLILEDTLRTNQTKGIYVGDTVYLCVNLVAVSNVGKKATNLGE